MRTDFTKNPIVQHCMQFSLGIISFVEHLEQQHRYIIANQLLKSGTSIGANVIEAQSAESKSDFMHKMKIADKARLKPGIGCICANTLIVIHLTNHYSLNWMRSCVFSTPF